MVDKKTLQQVVDKVVSKVEEHWMHVLYSYVLVMSIIEYKDFNEMIPSVIVDILSKYNQWIETSNLLNIFTSVLVCLCGLYILLMIWKASYNLFCLFTILWLIGENVVNDGWIFAKLYLLPFSYQQLITAFCIIALVLEIINIVRFCIERRKIQKLGKSSKSVPFYADEPTETDRFGRSHYAKLLIDKIEQTFKSKLIKDSAFNILINESYGFGKTSFLKSLKIEANQQHLIQLEFKPWLCESSEQMMQEYFDVVREALSKYEPSIDSKIKKYVRSLSWVDNEWTSWLKPFTAKSIWQANHDLNKVLGRMTHPVIVLIDDVDRLSVSEITTLFSLLRNTADFPNIINIVAAQKSYIENQLLAEGIETPEIFIKKFFNFEMRLPANDNALQEIIGEDILRLLSFVVNSQNIKDSKEKIKEEIIEIPEFYQIFADVRDWHRYYNIISFNLDILQREGIIEEVCIADVFALALIQHLSPSIYQQLRNQDSPILFIVGNGSKRYVLVETLNDLALREDPNNELREYLEMRGKTKAEEDERRKAKKKEEADTIHCIKDYVDRKTISEDIIVCKILDYLFPSPTSFQPGNRILYYDSFYKYFTGKYKHTQVSSREIKYLFMNASTDDYVKEISHLIDEEKAESILHKIHYLIDNRIQLGIDRLQLLRRYFDFVDILSEKNIPRVMPPECKIRQVKDVFDIMSLSGPLLKLYYKEGNRDSLSESERKELIEYLLSEKRYAITISFLKTFANYMYEKSLLDKDFCEDVANEVWNKIVREYLEVNPFSEESLALCAICTDSYIGNLTSNLHDYIVVNQNHLQWLYKCFKLYEENGPISWDYRFREFIGLKTDSSRQEIADSIAEKYPEEKDLMQDFKVLAKYTNLDQASIDEHPFLQQYKVNIAINRIL